MKLCLFITLVLLCSALLSLAGPSYLQVYRNDDGLAGNCVTLVSIDNNGVKWFACGGYDAVSRLNYHAVSRFDEASWNTWVLDEGWYISDMEVDGRGSLWVAIVGPYSNYLSYIDGSQLNYLKLPEYCFYPGALTFDLVGKLWVGGWNEGGWVARYDPQADSWDTWGPPPDEFLLDWAPQRITTGPDGRVWFVTTGIWQNGQWLGSRLYGSLESPVGIDFEKFIPKPHRNYVDLSISKSGMIWLISDEGVIVYTDEPSNWSVLEPPDLPQPLTSGRCVTAVGDEGVWFGFPGGAFWYDYTDWRWLWVGSPDVTRGVNDIAVDPTNGDVWFATYDGVYVMRGGPDAWPPVWIELEALALTKPDGATPTLSLLGSAEFQMDMRLDLYVAVELPDGTLLFAPNWSASMAPLVPNLQVPIGLNIERLPLVTLDTAGLPAGTYRWFAACTHAGSMDFASNIASCDWQFE